MSEILLVALYGLAVWRLASLLVREDGPADLFLRVRNVAGVNRTGEITGLAAGLSCVWCTSVWVALGITLAHGVIVAWSWWLLLLPFALSTIAIMIDEAILSASHSRVS